MSKKKKIKQYIAGILSVITVLGTVYQPIAVYSAGSDAGGPSPVVATEGDADDAGMKSVSPDSVSGNGKLGEPNSLSVSGGDVLDGDKLTGLLTINGSDAQYELSEYFTGETYVAIRGKSTSEVTKMRSGDDVSMDLAWDIDADAISLEGIAEPNITIITAEWLHSIRAHRKTVYADIHKNFCGKALCKHILKMFI